MGFKDGITNPDTTNATQMNPQVWVQPGAPEPGWTAGGAYQVVRIIRMFLDQWNVVPVGEQERIFGRRKISGAPLYATSPTVYSRAVRGQYTVAAASSGGGKRAGILWPNTVSSPKVQRPLDGNGTPLSRIVISTTKSCILYAAANVRGRNRATLSTASALDDTSDRTNGPLAADCHVTPLRALQ